MSDYRETGLIHSSLIEIPTLFKQGYTNLFFICSDKYTYVANIINRFGNKGHSNARAVFTLTSISVIGSRVSANNG